MTAQAITATGIKAQRGEMADVLRWAQATIEWAEGDPAKGSLVVGSPLAVALALRGTARWWFGRPGWHEDLDNAFAIAEGAEPLTLALVYSWKFGFGVAHGVLRADDATVAKAEKALQIAESSGDNYAVEMVKYVLGGVLVYRDAASDRSRGRELLAQVRDTWTHEGILLSELTYLDVLAGRERARGGDRDTAIPAEVGGRFVQTGAGRVLHSSNGFSRGETLLDRDADGDAVEAEAAIARLAAATDEGSVIRDLWLLRLRALLAKAHGEAIATIATATAPWRTLGFEGHIAWAEAMP